MPYEEESVVAEWMDHLKDLNVSTKKMFGCYCLYCDGQTVGWIHDSVLSLRDMEYCICQYTWNAWNRCWNWFGRIVCFLRIHIRICDI